MDTQVVLDDVNWTIQTLSGRGNTTIIYRKLSAILQELKNKIPAIKDFQAKRVFFFILIVQADAATAVIAMDTKLYGVTPDIACFGL